MYCQYMSYLDALDVAFSIGITYIASRTATWNKSSVGNRVEHIRKLQFAFMQLLMYTGH